MQKTIIRTKRDIPAVEKLASDRAISRASGSLPRLLVIQVIREVVSEFRQALDSGASEMRHDSLRERIMASIGDYSSKKITRVINGTGVLVHTNLGRAPLSESLFDRIKSQVTGYGNLEFDIISGRRGRRGELAEKYLELVSEAEAGTIVNNNAAALYIILNTFAARRKVVISRGELVQIGGGFRIPDIIRKSGARLLEVGTTNITSLMDYRNALEEKPALLLKVHRSNFAVSGFADEVGLKALVELGRESGIPVINDLGSGVLVDTTDIAGVREPTVQDSVRSGADLTCFSGDKLLGGVQAGLIAGRREMIDKIKKNPVFRVMRVDKTVFSAIEELLGYYLDGTWREKIKLWRTAFTGESELYSRGRRLLQEVDAGDKIILEGSYGQSGGGALPEVRLPSVALIFQSKLPAQKLAVLFRRAQPPVIGRITDEHFMIDLKAIDQEDMELLGDIIKKLIKKI
jgi:L-seryl-tRNA(Ser) seleniumtransferase